MKKQTYKQLLIWLTGFYISSSIVFGIFLYKLSHKDSESVYNCQAEDKTYPIVLRPHGTVPYTNISKFKRHELIYIDKYGMIMQAVVSYNDTINRIITYKRPNMCDASRSDYRITESVRYSELPYNKD